MSPPKSTTCIQPCEDFHELDKTVAQMGITVGQCVIVGAENKTAITALKKEYHDMQISNARRTAIYSFLGAAIPVILTIIGFLITVGV